MRCESTFSPKVAGRTSGIMDVLSRFEAMLSSGELDLTEVVLVLDERRGIGAGIDENGERGDRVVDAPEIVDDAARHVDDDPDAPHAG